MNLNENFVIELYSVVGELLMLTKNKKIDLSNFENGVYILKAKQGSKIEIKKIIKREQ